MPVVIDALAVARDIILWPGRWLAGTIEVIEYPTASGILLWLVITILSVLGLRVVAADAYGGTPAKLNLYTILLLVIGGALGAVVTLSGRYPLDIGPMLARAAMLAGPGVILWGRIIGMLETVGAEEYEAIAAVATSSAGGVIAYILYASGEPLAIAVLAGAVWVIMSALGALFRMQLLDIGWEEAAIKRLMEEMEERGSDGAEGGGDVDRLLEEHRRWLEKKVREEFRPKA